MPDYHLEITGHVCFTVTAKNEIEALRIAESIGDLDGFDLFGDVAGCRNISLETDEAGAEVVDVEEEGEEEANMDCNQAQDARPDRTVPSVDN